MARITSEAGDVPGIEFVAEAERCPVCDGALKVYKSRSRQVITLAAGPFRAIETLKQCGEDHTHPVLGSNALARQVLPRQRYEVDPSVKTAPHQKQDTKILLLKIQTTRRG